MKDKFLAEEGHQDPDQMPSLPLIPGIRVHYNPNDADTVYRLGLGEHLAGRTIHAVLFLERAVALKPKDAEYRCGLSEICIATGDWDKAEQHATVGLAIDPSHVALLSHRALVYRARNHLDAARDCLEKALTLKPDNPHLLVELGDCLLDENQIVAAEACFQKALDQTPDMIQAQLSLGNLRRAQEDFEKAEFHYIAARDIDPENAEAHAGIGYCRAAANEVEQATRAFAAATAYAPYEAEYLEKLFMVDKYQLAAWHLGMMHDRVRNDAFQEAIDRLAPNARNVLEIGTGSGLLAMMAARAGAGHVLTCEREARVADFARKIIAENGYADQIQVLHKNATELLIGKELAQPADLLICEIFDSGLLAEDALFSIYHARKHLLKPGAAIIPARAQLCCALITCHDLEDMRPVGDVNGFDLSLFNDIANRRILSQDMRTGDYQFLSDPVQLFSFDFQADYQLTGEQVHELTVAPAGRPNALVFWFNLELCEGVTMTTHPRENETHWQNPVQILSRDKYLEAGDVVRLSATYLRQFLFVDVDFGPFEK